MHVTPICLDLAKNVFQVHGLSETDEIVIIRPFRRTHLLPFFTKIEPCQTGMEACSGAHHRARELRAMGHNRRLIPRIYVKRKVRRH